MYWICGPCKNNRHDLCLKESSTSAATNVMIRCWCYSQPNHEMRLDESTSVISVGTCNQWPLYRMPLVLDKGPYTPMVEFRNTHLNLNSLKKSFGISRFGCKLAELGTAKTHPTSDLSWQNLQMGVETGCLPLTY
jgi:hypothetical protein